MLRRKLGYLWDVADAADAILQFVEGVSFQGYCDSGIIHSAVERKFEIIGEALSQLRKLDSILAAELPEIEKAIGFRNLLAHGYAYVEHDKVWNIICNDLPKMRRAAIDLMETLPGRPLT